jgi:hypothetical protein
MTLVVAREQAPGNTSRAKRDDVHGALVDSHRTRGGLPVPFVQRKPTCACGGGCPRCKEEALQAKLRINQPRDRHEREADRMAERVTQVRDPRRLEEPLILQRRAAQHHAETAMVPPIVHEVLRSPGQPLDPATRAFAEPRFGYDFSGVRVHADRHAAESARAVNALAYTVGQDVVFGSGRYAPGISAGRRLLAHELAHVVQQSGRTNGPPVLQRQEGPGAGREQAGPLPPLTIPGTGISLFPSPLRLQSLLGQRLQVPASLRLTNALGLGPGPSFIADISPQMLMLHLLQSIDLHAWTRPGTPPGLESDPASQARISLINPTVTFDTTTGTLRGRGTLSIGSDYPLTVKPPTDVSVEFASSQLGQFSGRLGYGPLHADFTLRLHYDTARFEQALRPVFAPEGGFAGFWARFQVILRDTVPGIDLGGASEALQSLLRSVMTGEVRGADFATRTLALLSASIPAGADLDRLRSALVSFAAEITHPGFTLAGGLGLGPIPLSRYTVTAPTTVPLSRPLYGAPAAFPLSYRAYGTVLAPAGSVTSVAVPAFGYTSASFGATSGTSLTAAVLPTLSPAAISAGEPLARQFPIYAYVEFSHIRRISSDLDLGLRLTLQVSTPDLARTGEPQGQNAADLLDRMLRSYQEASRPPGSEEALLPNIGLSVYGRFGGP